MFHLKRLTGMLALASFVTGCGATGWGPFAQRTTPCLTGPTPVVGRPRADSAYAVLRHRWEALPRLHPLAQAVLWPTLETWVPDVSDRVPEPACDQEIAAAAARALEGPRAPLSRLLLSRIVASTSPEVYERAATLRDDEFTKYTPAPDEPPGHAVSAGTVRDMAARVLVWQGRYRTAQAAPVDVPSPSWP